MKKHKRYRDYQSAMIANLLKRGVSEQDDWIVRLAMERAFLTLRHVGFEVSARTEEVDYGFPVADPLWQFINDVEEMVTDLRAYQHDLSDTLRERYRSDTDLVMAEFYGCSVESWQAWSRFVEKGAICMGTTRRGTACTRIVGQVPSPQEFIAGRSDRCHQHQTDGESIK